MRRTFPEARPALALPLADGLDHVPDAALDDDRHGPFRLGAENVVVDARSPQVPGRRGWSRRDLVCRNLRRRTGARVLEVLKVGLGVPLVFDLRLVSY